MLYCETAARERERDGAPMETETFHKQRAAESVLFLFRFDTFFCEFIDVASSLQLTTNLVMYVTERLAGRFSS